MSGWFRAGTIAVLRRLERAIDRVRGPRRARAGKVVLETYRSYGTAATLHVKGRLLRDRKILPGERGERRWRALLATWKRIFSHEIANVPVGAEWGPRQVEGVTDAEGYFHLVIDDAAATSGDSWQEVTVRAELADGAVHAVARVLVPPPEAEYGVVSDIDDTVIRTDATSLFRMLRTVVFQNAHVRLPFEGVAAFYRALHADGRNPLFYVSSGPWNLYDLLEHVFEIRGIPHGPIFLQDWGIDTGKLVVARHDAHKREQIDTLVGTYPGLPFILIGDSGQHDPEIYATVARHYPERVAAIYIRDVKAGPRHAAVVAISEELERDTGIPMLLVGNTLEAASDAARKGWIPTESLSDIAGETREDESRGPSL